MNCTRVSIGLLLAMSLALPAAAQQQKGDKELQISANLSFTRGAGDTTGNALTNVALGYYVTRQLEIRGGVGAAVRTIPACSQTQSAGSVVTCIEFNRSQLVADPTITSGFVLHFSAEGQKTVPYVGLDYAAIGVHGAGILTLTSSTTFSEEFPLDWTNNIRPNGGLKLFVKRNIAFDINVGWDKDLGTNSDVSTIDTRVGFSYVF